MKPSALRLAGCLCAALLVPGVASATLGGDRASVDADVARVQGARMGTTAVGSYAVHELRSAPGTTVREFVSASGRVFGVAWQGPWMPDMRQLLGPHFEAYRAAALAAQGRRRGRGPVVVETPELVVRTGGHAQAFSGQAYLPALVPEGVRPDSIR